MRNSFIIDCFQENPDFPRRGYAVVAIDVIRATTTAITAVASGRRCFPVPSPDAARLISEELYRPLLAGEVAGDVPDAFEVNNSPAQIAIRLDLERPLVLLSSSGTKLIHAAQESEVTYLACFRNHAAVSRHLIENHSRVALIGAGTRGEFREEDQMGCAWIAHELIAAGFEPENERTAQIAARWGTAPAEACLVSRSAEYLRKSGQTPDLDFTLQHVNDLPYIFMMKDGEVIEVPANDKFEMQFSLPSMTRVGGES